MTVVYDATFFAGRSETVSQSAAIVVPVIARLLAPHSVVDFGCGQGEWLDAFSLDDTTGVDIAAPEGPRLLRADLCRPLDLGRRYDLALCLEVGEHLPESAADVLIDTLTHHSAHVVFSAAVPGQEGKGHINCQPLDYWRQKFQRRGYVMRDAIRPLICRDLRVSPWYRSNIVLFDNPDALRLR